MACMWWWYSLLNVVWLVWVCFMSVDLLLGISCRVVIDDGSRWVELIVFSSISMGLSGVLIVVQCCGLGEMVLGGIVGLVIICSRTLGSVWFVLI